MSSLRIRCRTKVWSDLTDGATSSPNREVFLGEHLELFKQNRKLVFGDVAVMRHVLKIATFVRSEYGGLLDYTALTLALPTIDDEEVLLTVHRMTA